MNLQQLEYIIAIDTHRHFVTAAEHCFVTQATLSMMVKKLEEELGVLLFDRSKHPVAPTPAGEKIIASAKKVLQEAQHIHELAKEEKGETSGELRVGIIPTLAPYLLPLFLESFLKKYPLVRLRLSELTTEEIIRQLEAHTLDAGLLATPLNRGYLNEQPLFYESFVVYSSPNEKMMQKKFVLASDIDVNRLWLLEEGHCLRSQVLNLCELKKQEKELHHLDFEAGSIETLKRLVETNQGITILPELALQDMPARQQKNVRHFKAPAPVREISLVTYRRYSKKKLVEALQKEILNNIPAELKTKKGKEVTEI